MPSCYLSVINLGDGMKDNVKKGVIYQVCNQLEPVLVELNSIETAIYSYKNMSTQMMSLLIVVCVTVSKDPANASCDTISMVEMVLGTMPIEAWIK